MKRYFGELLFDFACVLLFPFYLSGLCGAWFFAKHQTFRWLYDGMVNYPIDYDDDYNVREK